MRSGLRERSGLTVSALSRLSGVSQAHLSNIEPSKRQASPDVIVRLARALQAPLLALLTDSSRNADHVDPGESA